MKQLRRATDDGRPPRPLPQACPLTLDDLLTGEPEAMEAILARTDA